MPNNNFQQTPYLQGGNPNTENRLPDGYSGGELGIRFTFEDRSDSKIAKRYQLVQADSVMDVEPYDGAVAWWLANSGYLVTTDVSVAGRGNIAGVFRNSVTLGNICCVQIAGRGDVDYDTGTPLTTGLFAVPSGADGKATAIAAGSPATYPALGVTVASVASSGTLYKTELKIPGRE